jgi:transposase
MRELMAGGALTSLTPAKATRALRGFRPRTGTDRVRVELATELIAEVRRFDEQLKANAAKITALLDGHGARLSEIDGIGSVLAARLLGRTGPPSRFVSACSPVRPGPNQVDIATLCPRVTFKPWTLALSLRTTIR